MTDELKAFFRRVNLRRDNRSSGHFFIQRPDIEIILGVRPSIFLLFNDSQLNKHFPFIRKVEHSEVYDQYRIDSFKDLLILKKFFEDYFEQEKLMRNNHDMPQAKKIIKSMEKILKASKMILNLTEGIIEVLKADKSLDYDFEHKGENHD
jgi:hypothetical protein